MTIRTRIAPSPTGYAHLGLIARALINYALAKKNTGQFIWRNDDTDRTRFVEDALEFNMRWVKHFGLEWDEGPDIGGPYAPYTQTERIDIYNAAIEKLIERGYAYRCFCTKDRLEELRAFQTDSNQQTRYDGRCRKLSNEEIQENLKNNLPFTIRIKVPQNRIIEFTDAITHNLITWNSNDVDDYIIVKSDGIPTYHLATVVDDIQMKITHALRGSEWISTTPVHVLLYEGLEVSKEEMPKIGHFTVILNPKTNRKFSKRDADFRINGLLQRGFLKEAILNYLMLLGWAPKDNREIFSLEEFIETFDLNGMQKSNPTWDQTKMEWFNGVYLRKMPLHEYVQAFKTWLSEYYLLMTAEEFAENFPDLNEAFFAKSLQLAKTILNENEASLSEKLRLVQERALSFSEVMNQIEFFYSEPENINWDINQTKNYRDKIPEIIGSIKNLFLDMSENKADWVQEEWVANMKKLSEIHGIKGGDSFMILRIAIVGSPFSPPLFESIAILGRDEVLKRLDSAK
jgi:glutamyl-tRNA synthetase